MPPRRLLLPGLLALTIWPLLRADERDRLTVGVQPDGRVVVPTNQILSPAGTQITFPGRPVDLAFADDGKTVVVKSMRELVFLDAATGAVRQTLPTPRRSPTSTARQGFSVTGLLVRGDTVYASDADDDVRTAVRQPDGKYVWGKSFPVPKPKVKGGPHPAGMAWQDDGHFWCCATRSNCVHLYDAKTGAISETVAVGVAPYTAVSLGAKVYVSNWGGDPPAAADPKANSSDTPVRIDPKTGIANHGSVSVLELAEGKWRQTRTITVGLHPSGLALSAGKKLLYVANANSDSVSVIDTATDRVVETIACRPEGRLPFGSGCNAVALGADRRLYVANGTNNCVAVVDLGAAALDAAAVAPGAPGASAVVGLIPTGWYPGAVLPTPDGKRLYVANVKGHGSLSQPRPKEKGKNSHDHLGSVSLIDVPDAEQLRKYTATVNANNRLGYSLAGLEKPRPEAKPMPVPDRHGEPSLFEHVIYVIKENRTYDQLLGDMKEGNGDPKLVLFGEEVTPNHHALARQFTLFDNFYCSGVLSADGHCWVNEAYVTDYLERSFGGFTRSYPDDGSDPLAYQPGGFLWDQVLARKKTLRIFGEFVESSYPKGVTWKAMYEDYQSGKFQIPVKAQANLKHLAPYTHPGYPWFPLIMPDVYRARLFLNELAEWEQKGQMPNLVYVTLPVDHTTGTRPGYPSPRASVADNDLALGQLVEGVTKSKFWPKTCIFVVEDDPQAGYDHVDGHRTVALAISPYTKRKFVDHTCYNQTGMVKTIELILGLNPMNQLDLSATAMRDCFQAQPDLTPYQCLPNRVPLDEMNVALDGLKGKARYWAEKSLALNFDQGDAADEDTLNRILWFSVHGEKPYPEAFAGGKEEDDDDD